MQRDYHRLEHIWDYCKSIEETVAHHYGSIRLDIVWNTILNDIPRLKSFCEAYLETAQHDTP